MTLTAFDMSLAYSDCFSDLLCDEDSTTIFSVSTNELPEYSSEIESPLQDTDEYIIGLLEDEIEFDGVSCGGSSLPPIDVSLRATSIAWILKVQRYYGFQSLTAYLSVSYFDRFLRLHHLPKMNGWPMQLLSVACLSLAAKMEEPLVPSLLDLQVEGPKFIFEPSNIQRMELLVLRVLNWRLRSISPFSYLSFFALKIDQTGTYSAFLESMAKQAILSTMQETSFLEYRPSCTAAAAILHAAHELPKFFSITAQHAESWCDGLLKDNITSCYELIQSTSLNNKPMKQPKFLPQLRVMTITSSDSSSYSSSSSPTSCYKRRKLNNKSWADNDKD